MISALMLTRCHRIAWSLRRLVLHQCQIRSTYTTHAADSTPATLHFDDARTAFAAKSTPELIRQLLVLRLCQVPSLVRNADALLHTSQRVLGTTITHGIIRHTFFNQFVAGEDGDSIQPTVQRLHAHGIGSILDYAAEDDVIEEGPTRSRTQPHDTVVARTYAYEDEALCDRHSHIFSSAIDAAARSPGIGFAAIKVTALGPPRLLERISTQLVAMRNLFMDFDLDHDGRISLEEFKKVYEQLFTDGASASRAQQVFDYLDYEHKGQVDYVAWTKQVRVQDAPLIAARCRAPGPFSASVLSSEELSLLDALLQRLDRLASQASRDNVRLMVDAEHSYFQPAIDHAVLEMQRKYNTTVPIVFNTYQCYTKDSHSRLLTDLERSTREGFLFGAKLVRGAYMQLERQRAEDRSYPCPILDSAEQTHENYNRCVQVMLEHVQSHTAELMIATHNQSSIELAVQRMQAMGISPSGGVSFGQLLGMADQLSYTLGAHGYKAYKYTPFGPLATVMPYLIRRAQENSTLLGGAQSELQLVQKEVLRRLTGGLLGG